jgi:hypothetical protein
MKIRYNNVYNLHGSNLLNEIFKTSMPYLIETSNYYNHENYYIQIDLLILFLIYVQMTELDFLVLHSDILVLILVIKSFTNYITLYKD